MNIQKDLFMSIIIVHYSRTGSTARLAETLARRLNADCDQISAGTAYDGPIGLLNAAFTAAMGSEGPARTKRYLRAYDHLIVAGPVWGGQLPGPLRRYLIVNDTKTRLAGAFCTSWHGGPQRGFFNEIREITGTATFPNFSVEQRYCDRNLITLSAARFARNLSKTLSDVA